MSEYETDEMPQNKQIPKSFQAQLFDLTGTEDGGKKGFVCFYVNEDGNTDIKVEKSLPPGEVPYGDIMEDQINQMREIKSLYKKIKKG